MAITKIRGRITGRDQIKLRYTATADIGLSGGATRFSATRNLVSSVTYGDNLPDWKSRIRRKQSATTTMSGTVCRTRNTAYFGGETTLVKKLGPNLESRIDNQLSGPALAFVGDPSSSFSGVSTDKAVNLAKMAFVKKAVDAQRAFQSGVFLGELRETIHLIRRPVSALRQESGKLINSWSQRARKIRMSPGLKNKPANHPKVMGALRKAAGGIWLEFSFGVQPLVNDAKDAIEAAMRLKLSYPPTKVVSGFSGKIRVGKTRSNTVADYDSIKFDYTTEEITEIQARLHGCVSTYDELARNTTFGQLGLNWHQVLPTVWELIPYSFLVDYFTNVGDIVEALAFNRASVRWAELSTVITRTNSLHMPITVSPGATFGYTLKRWRGSLGAGEAWVDVRSFSRTPFTGSLIPSFEFDIPGLKSRKWLNIGALILARGSQTPIRR